MTDNEIKMKEALLKIASYDASCVNGCIDEWAEADAFNVVTDIAKEALNSLTNDATDNSKSSCC